MQKIRLPVQILKI